MTTWTKKPSWSTVDNEEEELHWVQDNNNCPVMYMYLYVLCMYYSHTSQVVLSNALILAYTIECVCFSLLRHKNVHFKAKIGLYLTLVSPTF